MLARQLAYITYVRGSMSTLQILLFPCFYSVWSPTLSREEPIKDEITDYDYLDRQEAEYQGYEAEDDYYGHIKQE